LSVAVLSATTPVDPAQVASTAAGRKCSTLNELSVWSSVSDAGHPAFWAAKLRGTTTVLSLESGGPLPTLLPVPVSSVISMAHWLAESSQ
jgi:hypothetical protein